MNRTRRRTFVLITVVAIAATTLSPPPASAAVAWGPQRTLADWAWSTGSSLAVTGSGPNLVVHQLLTTDNIDGAFATDHGPYEGVFLTSSQDRGITWRTPVRVSQPKRHAERGALAADGDTLYAVWTTRASYDHENPSGRRILYFRVNDAAGASGAWGPTVRLSKQKGRVDPPSVAVSSGRVYVVWTDANTGDVRLAVSKDDGSTWKRHVLGKARGLDTGGEGHLGLTSVGAAGSNVGVAWLATRDGAVRGAVSTNGGRRWRPVVTLASGGGGANGGSPSVAGRGKRLAFAWTTSTALWVRPWIGSFEAAESVVGFGGGPGQTSGGYDAQVVVGDAGAIGVAWSGCRSATCDTGSALTRTQVLWSQSSGGAWSAPSLVKGASAADQRINDGASVVWLDADTRIVSYAGSVSGFTSYRLYARVGNGVA